MTTDRPSFLGALLHLGKRAGGTVRTITNAHAAAMRLQRPAYILSPRPETVLAKAKDLGLRARIVERDRWVYVEIRAS